jgi:hypothetical protein
MQNMQGMGTNDSTNGPWLLSTVSETFTRVGVTLTVRVTVYAAAVAVTFHSLPGVCSSMVICKRWR